MYVLIVEQEPGGHHMSSYVRFMARGAVRRGWKVRILTARKSAEHPALKIVANEFVGELPVHFMPRIAQSNGTSTMSLLFNQMAYFKVLARSFKELCEDEIPDLVYLMNLEAVDKVMAILGSPFGNVPFSGMLVNVKYHRFQKSIGPPGRYDKLYKKLFERLLRIKTLLSITVIDEFFVEYTQQQRALEYDKVKFVPDPGELEGSESVEQAREQLAIPHDRFVILVYGILSARKGIKELLQAVSLMEDDTILVLLAGKVNKDINQLLHQPIAKDLVAHDRLFVVSGYQGVEQEYRLFRSANVVWLGYVSDFYGKSAVMPQAGSIGLPILASNTGLIGKITKENGLGLVFDPYDSHAVAKEIKRLQSDRCLQKQLGGNGRRFAKQSSAEEFGNALCSAIDICQDAVNTDSVELSKSS